MSDRVAEFVLRLASDSTDITTALAGLKNQFRSTVSELQSQADKLDLFGQLTTNIPKIQASFDKSTASAKAFQDTIDRLAKSGEPPIQALSDGLKRFQAEAAAASKELDKEQKALAVVTEQLKAAGVSTTNYTATQTKMAEAIKIATAAATEQANKQALGLKTLSDVRPEIQRLTKAYVELRDSGTLSASQLAVAQQAFKDRIAETVGQVTKLKDTGKSSFLEFKDGIQAVHLKFLAITAAIGGVAAAIGATVDSAKTFNQSVAAIGTVTNLSATELRALGVDALALSRRLGIDVNEALKAVYELLRSGVPADNVVAVLEVSAKAAKAALTDTATGAKAASVLMDAFGVSAADVGGALDVVINSARNGGPTLAEFANNASAVGNAARATGQDLNTVLGILQVMTDKSNDAAGSAALLAKILINVANPTTVAKLRELGIETANVAEILQQLDAKGLRVNDFLELGVASGKAGASLAALTNNAKEVPAAIEAAGKASGTIAEIIAKNADTAAERTKRWKAETEALGISIGNVFGAGGTATAQLTTFIKGFNDLDPALKQAVLESGNLSTILGAAAAGMFGLGKATAQVKDDTTALTAAQKESADALAAQAKAVSAAQDDLARLSLKLQEQIGLIQAAASRDITDLQARASAAIAELDRSLKATADTAAKTLEIQTKLAADRLAIITKSESDIQKATDAAIVARINGAKKAGDTEKDVANDVARIRIAALSPVLAQYQAHYDAQVGIAQAALAKVQTIELARIDIAKTVETSILAVQQEGLSSYDKYLADRKRIEDLIAEGRQKASNGEINEAKALFQEAIGLANGLKTVVSANGVTLVTESERRYEVVKKLKEIGVAANEALGDQGNAAKKGADATIEALKPVQEKITEIRTAIDEAKASAKEGVLLKVATDEASVAAAQRTLDDLAQDRTVTITVTTVQANAGGGFIGGFARGGPVASPLARAVQAFAGGGGVFRSPTWNKVPGSGNGDTVPALLREGSFVVRKAASTFAGDGVMSMLAQHFAIGGGVNRVGDIASRILGGAGGSLITLLGGIGLGGIGTGGTPLQQLKVKAWQELLPLIELAKRLPQSGSEDDVAEYLARVLQLINDSSDLSGAQSLLATVEPFLTQYRAGIEEAMRYHVPYVVRHEKAEQLQPKKLAAGGSVDSVPAYLTPGEYVIQPGAVQRIAHLFGGGFLPALNAMKVPRGFLDGLSNFGPPPLRFATGGMVPGGPAVSMSGGGGRGGAGLTINIYAQRVDEAEVRRSILPILDRIDKRSK